MQGQDGTSGIAVHLEALGVRDEDQLKLLKALRVERLDQELDLR